MSTTCKPVWPTVFFSTCFLIGYNYGVEKQLSLTAKAYQQLDEEKQLIIRYNRLRWDKDEREAAIAEGEDPSLYDVPGGLRSLARSFKETSL